MSGLLPPTAVDSVGCMYSYWYNAGDDDDDDDVTLWNMANQPVKSPYDNPNSATHWINTVLINKAEYVSECVTNTLRILTVYPSIIHILNRNDPRCALVTNWFALTVCLHVIL